MLNQNVDSKIGAMADEIQPLQALLDNIRVKNLNVFLEKLRGVNKVSLECTEIEGKSIICNKLYHTNHMDYRLSMTFYSRAPRNM